LEATKSICAITEPIVAKRRQLESQIDQTWEMLREQSKKAAVRAEESMAAVRNILDLSHDLGAVRRHFLASEEDRHNAHDLSQHADWWLLPADQRSKLLRNYWRSNLLPRDVQLSEESNRVFTSIERELEEPFLSAKKKRVFVASTRNAEDAAEWRCEIPAKSYEVWTLLCWGEENHWLDDFVVPQKYYAQSFAQAKKSLKKDEKIPVVVRRTGEQFFLSIHGSEPVEVTDLRSNYEPLQ